MLRVFVDKTCGAAVDTARVKSLKAKSLNDARLDFEVNITLLKDNNLFHLFAYIENDVSFLEIFFP